MRLGELFEANRCTLLCRSPLGVFIARFVLPAAILKESVPPSSELSEELVSEEWSLSENSESNVIASTGGTVAARSEGSKAGHFNSTKRGSRKVPLEPPATARLSAFGLV